MGIHRDITSRSNGADVPRLLTASVIALGPAVGTYLLVWLAAARPPGWVAVGGWAVFGIALYNRTGLRRQLSAAVFWLAILAALVPVAGLLGESQPPGLAWATVGWPEALPAALLTWAVAGALYLGSRSIEA